MTTKNKQSLLDSLEQMSATELRRVLAEHLTQQKLGLYWERNAIDHDKALNANVVLPRLVPEWSHTPDACTQHQNLIIEGDNFDSLRLLRSTHAGRIRVIYIDPPYNTGNKDWVYNDSYVGANDRWRHSQWLEFLYQRLTLARELLTPDGVILVSINDENRSRLELLMDEVFPGRRIGSLVWRTKDTGNDLTQRFSHVHEHVLVYANAGFSFNGRATDKSKFRNPDKDTRGDWSPQPLTSNKSLEERRNTYYPIQDPDTGYWYPCDPDTVWRYASEKVIRKLCDDDEEAIKAALAALRSDTMETLISKKLIYFPPCKAEEVMLFETKADLLAAIKAGKGPVLPKKKTPLLRADLPDLDFWVGKSIATGRPSRKEHWSAKPEADRLAPLGSWIAGMNEDIDDEDVELALLRSTRGGVATDEVKNVLGSKAFQHPKPLSLIKGLLSQAIFEGIADQALQVEARPLPDVMIFPQDISLDASAKNIYGVFPPSTENAQEVESVLFMDERQWWADQSFELDGGASLTVGRYDGAVKINQLERDFAQALDEADFVHWWHRNPDKKPYAVRVVRSEHDHYFYPDFVVCVAHESDDPPMQRLLETKESTKDAARKAKHFPAAYGKVLFLTPDGNRLKWVNDDGSLGDVVKLTEMGAVHDRLKATKPVTDLAMSK